MKIIAHTLVKNEENFIWYAINSVIDHVDKIMIWDNGSSDSTVQLVKSIASPKIEFAQKDAGDFEKTARLRQEMLERSDCDWLMILDGDEIWHADKIRDLRFEIEKIKDTKDLIVNPVCMLVGDIFHYQEEAAGRYNICGRIGHYNVKFIRRGIPGLRVTGVWPNEAYVDNQGRKVQDLPKERIFFSDTEYLHASFLKRSDCATRRIKYEIGNDFPLDYFYPEVFFEPRPVNIPNPWSRMDLSCKARAYLETPLKKIKRRILK
jgi:glycosyltransferase involved in cell wall biosynthesis